MAMTPNDIIDYETGEMDDEQIPAFFQELIDSGLAWKLQGHYGRTATSLIEQGLCHAKLRHTWRKEGLTMKIQPKLAYRNPCYPINEMNPNKVYDATPATNQPNWQEREAIFAGGHLLEKGEYTTVSP